MQIINQKTELSRLISSYKKKGMCIGFVPTLGALHEGHLSLVKTAYENCEVVVISIFVNPTQFDNPSDLEKYPKILEKDLHLLENSFPKSIVFAPSTSEIYGKNILTQKFDFGFLENEMEGKYRTGHFDGVATVLQILFDIVKPDKAFFGEKDFQQLQIVRKLVEITKQPVEIIGCAIAREPSGLAMSSRNERLRPIEREKAAFLHEILQQAKADFGTKSADDITQWALNQFEGNNQIRLEYFEIADVETLKTVKEKQNGKKYRAFVAAYVGDVRLIDNIALN
ncbi:MAG TPA: pantoate--beta-alanine ligase [Flavobacteriaceae bacterium]|nr:pantoate--beta-alanine ligase [Flavobacteriaceae bacterium]